MLRRKSVVYGIRIADPFHTTPKISIVASVNGSAVRVFAKGVLRVVYTMDEIEWKIRQPCNVRDTMSTVNNDNGYLFSV